MPSTRSRFEAFSRCTAGGSSAAGSGQERFVARSGNLDPFISE